MQQLPAEIVYLPGLQKKELPLGRYGCTIIIGQLGNLKRINFDDISCVVPENVDENVRNCDDLSFSFCLICLF